MGFWNLDPFLDPNMGPHFFCGSKKLGGPDPKLRFGSNDDPNRVFENGSVWTRTRPKHRGSDPLLTLAISVITPASSRMTERICYC